MAAFPPQLYLIGAQKAGTTSLAYLLDQHPDIAVSNPKEPGFFNQRYGDGMEWYRRCFPRELPALLVDASTGYTMATVNGAGRQRETDGAGDAAADAVPRRIKEGAPEAKFIYVLRDPVDRTVSAYQHDRRVGRLGKATLREAVAAMPFYADVSRYHQQIAPFLRHFPRERFLFVDFASLSADPAGVARDCIAFAGLDPEKAPLALGGPKNAAFQFNGLGRRFFNLFPDERAASRFVGAVKRLTPGAVHRVAKAALTRQAEPVSPADREWLAGLFAADNPAMEALAGFRFYR